MPRTSMMTRLFTRLGSAGLVCLLVASGPGCDKSNGDDDDDSGDETAGEVVCPPVADSLAMINPATWAIFGEYLVNTDAGPTPQYFPIGTAWAIDRRLLVTNAHVAEAYEDTAAAGVQLSRAIAIQAGTGVVVELLRKIVHPDYTGDPLSSPDVALFTTKEEMQTFLPLALDTVPILLGDPIHIVGFPGDVTDAIEIIPGTTVPQATSLTGAVTALRSHDASQMVTPEEVDVIQHQAPTTPGTSGSSMVSCGLVIGVNNAGTVQLVVSPQPDGSFTVTRQAAASNNFAVHVRHIRYLLGLFADLAIQGEEIPVDASIPGGDTGTTTTTSSTTSETTSVGDPATSVGDEGGPAVVANLQGQVGDPYPHTFVIQVTEDGAIAGVSTWGPYQLNLAGLVYTDGRWLFADDAYEQTGGTAGTGLYEATVYNETTITGVFWVDADPYSIAPFTAVVF